MMTCFGEDVSLKEERGVNTKRSRACDLTGQTFGYLTVLTRAENSKTGFVRWRCRCNLCGSDVIAFASNLKRGRSKMCPSCSKKARNIHGLSRDRIYPVWQAIIRRCENPGNEHFKDYGGRGIKVCNEWHDVKKFAEWAYSNGFDPDAKQGSCTIERRDVNGDYCPENCYWADMRTQERNRRNNHRLIIDGKDSTITELSESFGILENTIAKRLKRGWSSDAALKVPVDKRRGGKRKPVLCINDGKSYRSLYEAAYAYKLSYDKVRRAVDTGKDVDGHTFVTFVGEAKNESTRKQ